MNLVPRPELAPSICVICEAAHTTGDPAWVDTLRNFDVGRATYLTGRKYVCGACAARIAMAVGYFAPAEKEALQKLVDDLGDDVERLMARADDSAELLAILARAQADLDSEE